MWWLNYIGHDNQISSISNNYEWSVSKKNILLILDALKTRKCITDREYTKIKSPLTERMHLNLYKIIDSTIENKTRDDKNEVLGLLSSIKDKEAK